MILLAYCALYEVAAMKDNLTSTCKAMVRYFDNWRIQIVAAFFLDNIPEAVTVTLIQFLVSGD